jgi:SAM-dependent methyltransferase
MNLNCIDRAVLYLWGKGYGATLHERIIALLKKSGAVSNKKIKHHLDLGSGDLSFYNKISFFSPQRSFSSDLEISQDHSNNSHILCDFNKSSLPFKDDGFDLITCINVIEHLYDTDGFLLEVKRILSKKGVLVIATNNVSCWTNIVSLLFGRQPNTNCVSDYGNFDRFLQKDNIGRGFSHRRIFSFHALKKVLEFHGFKSVSSTRCIFYPFSGWLERIFEKIFRIYCAYIVFVAVKQDPAQ